MTGTQYAITAYAIGLGLMLLYGLSLWLEGRAVRRRRSGNDEEK
jgi:hypothetical protein